MSLRRTSFLACLVVSVTAALALGGCGPSTSAADSPGAVKGSDVVGGPFHLVNQAGQPVDQGLLVGRWSAVFFGYTYCPDVCPTTLQTLALAQNQLGAKRPLQVIFISVDPARDTPGQLKAYLAAPAFPRGTVGLTGSDEQVAAAAKAYRVFYLKEGSGDGYSMSHSSAVYLMNPQGRFDRVLSADLKPDEIAQQIGEAMRDGPQGGA